MLEEREMLRKYLSRHSLRVTPQREMILNVFLKREGHVSAEELYDHVRKLYPSIGQATVYRNLKLFSDAGLAREVDFGDGVVRYEHSYNHPHHDHLICRGCGKTVEVVDDVIEELQKRVAEKFGFELTDHAMYLYGKCPDCRRKNKNNE